MPEHRSVRRVQRALVLGASVGGVAALSAVLALPAGAAVTNPANQNIVGSGSSTTYTMMQSLDSLFNNAASCTLSVATGTQPLDFSCPSSTGDPLALQASPTATPENPFADVVTEEPPIGSSNGIAQLEEGPGSSHSTTVNVANNVDFARSSRNFKTTDDKGLNFVAYAADSISWFHFTKVNANYPSTSPSNVVSTPSAGVPTLTQAELQAIYSGSINNWDQVGGKNAPIVVFSAQEGSGTQSTFKTWLGSDPTASGNQVNCDVAGTNTPGTNSVPGHASGFSNCQGPVVIFENEDRAINSSSFLTSQTSFLASSSKWAGRGKTRTSAEAAAGSKVLTVRSVSGLDGVPIAPGTSLTIGSQKATVKSVSGKNLTLTSGLVAAVPSGSTVKWVGPNRSATNAEIQGDAIFFYSFGAFSHQCAEPPAGSLCGGSEQDGNVPGLGEVNGAEPTEANTLEGTFPITRFLYNVYVNGSDSADQNPPSAAALNYVSELGFICKPQNATITDPATGNKWITDIQSAISNAGFYPLSAGSSSGSVNQKPFEEGSVGSPATNILDGTKYAPYDNTNQSQLAGGPDYANDGQPMGFCQMSTTDGNATS